MRWILKRLCRVLLVIYASITITFFIIRVMPGNPMDALIVDLMQQGLSYEEALKFASALFDIQPNKPLWEQYIDYILNLLRGNMGYSYAFLKVPVIQIISYALPWTVFLLSISISISFALGVALGMFIGYMRGSKLDNIFSLFASITTAIPSYLIGVVFLYFLAFIVGAFPKGGNYSIEVKPGFTLQFIADVLYHAALPILTYVFVTVGMWILAMKASTISVLGEDYVLAAEARGLPKRRIVISYVGRNAILPVFTTLAITVGYMFGGSVFIETIFTYPGIGYFLTNSVGGRDYPLMQGIFLLVTVVICISNFLADILYSKLDPRVKLR